MRYLTVAAVAALVAAGLLFGGAALPVVLTGAFGIVTLLWQQSLQRQGELEKQLATEKRAHSKTYVTLLAKVAASTKGGPKVDQVAIVRELRELSFTGMLLGSDEVIRAHARFLRVGNQERGDGRTHTLPAVADVLIALRREIVPATKLTPREILAVFVNEPLDQEWFDAWNRERAGMDL